jgi:hypothetical protein
MTAHDNNRLTRKLRDKLSHVLQDESQYRVLQNYLRHDSAPATHMALMEQLRTRLLHELYTEETTTRTTTGSGEDDWDMWILEARQGTKKRSMSQRSILTGAAFIDQNISASRWVGDSDW